MSQATQPSQATGGSIEAENGQKYPAKIYYRTKRAVGKQQWVADQWAEGALPTHSCKGNAVVLYTSTRNFEGKQYPEGHGKLKHYRHIEAIRTRNGLILGDKECYARGWAKCNKPRTTNYRLPLTTIKAELRGEDNSIYDIVEVDEAPDSDDAVVVFEGGETLLVGSLK